MAQFDPRDHQRLIGGKYRFDGELYDLVGIMLGDDDWYWVLWSSDRKGQEPILLSCVSTPEKFGYELQEG